MSGITKNTWSVQCDSVRTAALSPSPRFLLTTSVLKHREVPATVSSLYVSVLYTAMLRTSIAAVVLGWFYLCPLDCDALVTVVDCAAVETGCMLEKYIKVHPVQLPLATTTSSCDCSESQEVPSTISASPQFTQTCCTSCLDKRLV